MEFRLLTEEDTEQYRALRLQALNELPANFASSYETEKKKSIEELIQEITPSASAFVMGAFADAELAGIAAFKQENLEKMKHRGQILGMYISPVMRGKGLGKKLLSSLIERIRENAAIEKIDLAVAVDNHGAKALYESLGFVQFGEYTEALKLADGYVDEVYMCLELRR
ncbi:GNAT family N-acetyltransferase [Metabacillus idriensis]|uniref:GNAT family N-acetyltransferase n=1 Tax=Metabacillus idriensis TaxID=324768 RepID=UPI00281328E7|nr:GNAT family N-acetyltransferase [Metabacillus idriensis]MDR0136997.1 GNAT family N-acetyltransferase [Metabacillus idriensis]